MKALSIFAIICVLVLGVMVTISVSMEDNSSYQYKNTEPVKLADEKTSTPSNEYESVGNEHFSFKLPDNLKKGNQILSELKGEEYTSPREPTTEEQEIRDKEIQDFFEDYARTYWGKDNRITQAPTPTTVGKDFNEFVNQLGFKDTDEFVMNQAKEKYIECYKKLWQYSPTSLEFVEEFGNGFPICISTVKGILSG
jgi:hypothetical protein